MHWSSQESLNASQVLQKVERISKRESKREKWTKESRKKWFSVTSDKRKTSAINNSNSIRMSSVRFDQLDPNIRRSSSWKLWRSVERLKKKLTEITGNYLELLEIIWNYLKLFGITWNYLELLEIIWNYLKLFGITWNYLELLEIIWNYLKLF